MDRHVDQVLRVMEPQAGRQAAVDATIRSSTTGRTRMNAPVYRARRLHIGRGTIERVCKQRGRSHLKLAGMIGDAEGAEAVAVVRAWFKRERREEAMRLRPPSVERIDAGSPTGKRRRSRHDNPYLHPFDASCGRHDTEGVMREAV